MEKININTYLSIVKLSILTNVNIRKLQRWCASEKVQSRQVYGNGGVRYEILVSSLPEELQKKIAEKSALEHGVNAGFNASPHPSPLPFTRGEGVGLNGEGDKKDIPAAQATAQDFLYNQTGGKNTSSYKSHITSESCALTEEQAQTLISFGLMNEEKEVKSATESQKKKALAWVDLIELWHEYRCKERFKSEEFPAIRSEELGIRNGKREVNKSANSYMKSVDSEFVELFNGGGIYPELYKQIGKISRSTLHRKAKIYKENKKDFYALIPDYGTNNKFRSKLSLIERYYLLKIMLHQNCYTLGRAYEIINRILIKEGIKICSYAAYKRAWDYVMKNDYARVMFARGGLKVYKDKAAPYIMRKNNVLGFGDELIGDGHTLDFMVRNPFNGKPCRAALIGFLDSASGDLAGYDIMLTENTQVIASALRNAIIYMGKYPKVVHLDNGRAFKSKYFTQTASLKTTNIQGLYAKLNIETLFSKAYNGRAKTIERFFKEFTESEAKTWASYIGNCVDNKPAHVKRNEKFHGSLAGGYVPTIQEVKAGIDLWLNEVYRKRACKADNNLTISEYVNKNKGNGVNIDDLDDLMMAEETRKIQRNGVKLFDTYYWSEKLFGLKDSCIIKYSYFDLSYVKVYSLKGEYICRADRMLECHPLARQLGTAKDYEEYKYMTRRLEKLDKETLKPLKKMLKNMYKGQSAPFLANAQTEAIEIKPEYLPAAIGADASTAVSADAAGMSSSSRSRTGMSSPAYADERMSYPARLALRKPTPVTPAYADEDIRAEYMYFSQRLKERQRMKSEFDEY